MNRAKRQPVVDQLARGLKPADIAKNLNVARSFVYSVKNDVADVGAEQAIDRKVRDAPRPVRSVELRDRVAERVREDPQVSIRELSRSTGIARSSMQRLVQEDLDLTSYRMKRPQAISDAGRHRRADRCRLLLNRLKGPDAGKVIIFSDEKFWTVEKAFNRQNDRFLAPSGDSSSVSEEHRVMPRQQHAKGAMFLGVVASDGRIAPPIWVPAGVKVDSAEYVRMLQLHVIPWIRANYKPGTFVFQQDGAPAHTAAATQAFLRGALGADFWSSDAWPPSSPDCSPLDYSVWNNVGRVASRVAHDSVEAMKVAVSDAWLAQESDAVRSACAGFRRRIEAVCAAKGGYIE